MATLREHLLLDIKELQDKFEVLKATSSHLLDTEVLELRDKWEDLSQHFYSGRVDKELAAKKKAEEATKGVTAKVS